MMEPESHWRPDETLIDWVEEALRWPKVWELLEELPPSIQHNSAYEAELHFVPQRPDLSRRGPLWIRGRQEHGGTIFINIWLGGSVLRRAHIGNIHQDPGAGPIIRGPHIHFPTTAFSNIGTRGTRSRAYEWNVSSSLSLRDAVQSFSQHVYIIGEPDEQRRLMEEPDGLR